MTRLSSFVSLEKRRLIMKQFGYCPLIWIFHDRTLNKRINRMQERALRIAYRDRTSNFTELLLKDNAVTVHQRNLLVLDTEVYKVRMSITPQLIKELFSHSTQAYHLRSTYEFKLENVKTVHYGSESLSFSAPKIWELRPLEFKSFCSLEELPRNLNRGSHKILHAGSVNLPSSHRFHIDVLFKHFVSTFVYDFFTDMI